MLKIASWIVILAEPTTFSFFLFIPFVGSPSSSHIYIPSTPTGSDSTTVVKSTQFTAYVFSCFIINQFIANNDTLIEFT